MKTRDIIGIAIIPLIICSLAFTNLPPQGKGNGQGKQDKGNKSQGQSADKGNGNQAAGKPQKGNGQGNQDIGSGERGKGRDGNPANNSSRVNRNSKGGDRGNVDRGNGNSKSDTRNNGANGNGNSNKDRRKENSDLSFKSRGNGNSRNLNGKRGIAINWNLNDFDNRWSPRNTKKVTICHRPNGDSNRAVTIRVSENALQAHRNHGDVIGECKINYDGWSRDYIRSRENVFYNYEQTWERISFGEALLQLAAQKLLGLRTNLDRDRSRLSNDEIRRREALIYELENNSMALDDQLGYSRQRLDSDVNIIVNL